MGAGAVRHQKTDPELENTGTGTQATQGTLTLKTPKFMRG